YGCVLLPPVTPDADFGILFMHNEGWSTMCGHGIIAVVKVLIQTGLIAATKESTEINIDTPAGRVTAWAQMKDKKIQSIAFRNVPSFVCIKNETVDVPQVGTIELDIAFGGAFYAFVDAGQLDVKLEPQYFRELIHQGMAIKRKVMQTFEISHPDDADLNFVYGTIFTGPSPNPSVNSRHVCVFANGQVDRSPTGTGVSGRMALHYADGQIQMGERLTIDSIIGTTFSGSIQSVVNAGPYEAVVPEIQGTAFITGTHDFMVDPNDTVHRGFVLR
ncbi:MAG: proline racemase, partial [Caldithrix sp.]|nr:proline racemase [Caldithrix sp.]